MIIGDGSSRVHSGAIDVIAEPWPALHGRHPTLYNHSAASDAREASGWALPAVTNVMRKLVDNLKFSVISATMSGSFGAAGLPSGSTVGAATHRGRIEEAISVHNAMFGSSGTVGLTATSMGTTNSLVYALEHPTLVRWMVLFSPVVMLKEYESLNTQNTRAAIDTGWNVTAGNLPSQADVYTRIMAGGLGAIPILWINSSDDPYSTGTFAAKYAQVVAITGGLQQALGPLGHGNGTIAGSDLVAVQAFIEAHD